MVLNLSKPASSVFWVLWHFLAVIAIVLVPIQVNSRWIWNLEPGAGTFYIGMALAYCASVITLTFYTPKGGKIRLVELASIFLSIFGIFFLFLLVSRSQYFRDALILCLVIASAFIFLSISLKTTLQKPALFIVAALVVLFPLWGTSGGVPPVVRSLVEHKVIRTGFYNLIATYHGDFGVQEVTGGAISKFGDRYLLATGDGQLHVFSWDSHKRKLETRKLSHRVPLNADEFARDVKDRPKKVNPRFFRTADILVQDFGSDFRLFASHHFWDREKQCFTIRISSIHGNYAEFGVDDKSNGWRTVYETVPCLGFKDEGGEPFAGYASGGKMVLLDSHTLLLSVGDHDFDGVESTEILAQDPASSYGKTILVDLKTHAASVYSSGHRNAQGLAIDRSGTIWLAEHGPKGGDELNLILKGKNYGWPLVTYGTSYGQPFWPFNPHQGRHDDFEEPVYAWIPSIGISAVTSVQGPLFGIWQDDLIVASLRDRALWRMRIDNGRVIFTERIEIGPRIRDVIEGTDGSLILWTEHAIDAPTETTLVIIEPVVHGDEPGLQALSSRERGELLFIRCNGCHRVDHGDSHGIGPALKGVFQSPIAGAKGYTYSEALKAFSGRWTEKNLDAYLTNPQTFIPGTSMQFAGIPDSKERASLIEYLKSLK